MSELQSKLWVKKYAPTTLKDYIFQNDSQKLLIESIVTEKLVGHALFSGIQGTGKTSLSNILLNELNVDPFDVLRINASDENSIDVIRNKVVNFISVCPNGEFRVVQFEEMDALSHSAMAGLRAIMEEFIDTARFIFTCNYVHKVIPALKSRCQYQLDFKSPDKTAILKRIINILLAEHVKFDPPVILKYVDAYYPDVRKIIQTIQQHSVDGQLLDPTSADKNDDYKFKFLELLETDNWTEARNIICSQVSNDEIESVFRFLYENLHQSAKFKDKDKWEAGQIMIADYLYKDSLVADREINISALLIDLGRI